MDLKALRNIGYGMYIVSSCKDGKCNGQIANTVFQITADPVLIGISINKENLTHEYIESSKAFSLSVLTTDADFKFIGTFGFKSGKNTNKFETVETKNSKNGIPIVLDNTCAWLECKIVDSVDCGTHTLFLGELLDCGILKQAEPMTYSYYHQVIKGKSPKTAPTYIENT